MPRGGSLAEFLHAGFAPSNLSALNVALRKPWTVERFLAWEDRQEGRHEFDGTRIHEMAGGSRAHQRIVSNLVRLLGVAFADDALKLPEVRAFAHPENTTSQRVLTKAGFMGVRFIPKMNRLLFTRVPARNR